MFEIQDVFRLNFWHCDWALEPVPHWWEYSKLAAKWAISQLDAPISAWKQYFTRKNTVFRQSSHDVFPTWADPAEWVAKVRDWTERRNSDIHTWMLLFPNHHERSTWLVSVLEGPHLPSWVDPKIYPIGSFTSGCGLCKCKCEQGTTNQFQQVQIYDSRNPKNIRSRRAVPL